MELHEVHMHVDRHNASDAVQKRKAEAEVDAVTADGSDSPACTDTGLPHEPMDEHKEAAVEEGEPSHPAGVCNLLQ